MNNNLQLETIHPQKDDVILLKFDIKKIDISDVVKIFQELNQELKNHFPNNQLIAIPNDIEISFEDRQKLIKYLTEYNNEKVDLN